MFQRRVADLWRHCADGVTASVDWAEQYQQLLQGINLRGVFRFPVERYAGQLLPSQTVAKTSASD